MTVTRETAAASAPETTPPRLHAIVLRVSVNCDAARVDTVTP